MKKIIWTADFSAQEVTGGAELVDDHLIQVLRQRDYTVTFVKAARLTPNVVKEYHYLFTHANC